MNRPRILIVSYNWPPRNAIGTRRPYAWASIWSESGAQVTVLTATKHGFDAPLDLNLPPPPGIRVVEVPYLGTRRESSRGDGKSVPSWFLRVRHAKRVLARYSPFALDARARWYAACRPLLRRLAYDHDCVVSTFGPSATHRIASAIKAENPRVLWVADYRDLWSQSHLADWSWLARRAERRRELATVGKHADIVTTVSEELAGSLASLLRRDVEVIMNGYDSPDCEVMSRIERRMADPSVVVQGGCVRIVHSGMIYPGRRNPLPLLSAVAKLDAVGEASPDRLRIEFYGARIDGLEDLIRLSGAAKYVDICGHVSRSEMELIQRDATALLLLESGENDAAGVVPGKVFEYIDSGAPIISIGSRKVSAVARILDATGLGHCHEDDEGDIAETLKQLLAGSLPKWYCPVGQSVMPYGRRRQAAKMLNELIRPRLVKGSM